MSSAPQEPFDPLRILTTLDRHRVAYVLVGALAGVLHGTDEITGGVDIVPQMKAENIERLERALAELDARLARRKTFDLDLQGLERQPVTRVGTVASEVKVVPQPEGTSGYDDLRRASTREPLGHGVRAPVASVGDLARMLAALGRASDAERLAVLRRLLELDRSRGIAR
jgi:hypothetical protein